MPLFHLIDAWLLEHLQGIVVCSPFRPTEEGIVCFAGAHAGRDAEINIRVRMGIASGFLYPGESLHGHPTIEAAKGGRVQQQGKQ